MLTIRTIRTEDDPFIDQVIVTAMNEIGAPKEGTILGDPSRSTMSQNFSAPNEVYYVAEWSGKIVGGAGIGQLPGGEGSICELQRMFLSSESRGKGIGKALMDQCIEKATEFGYKGIYLETLPIMEAAQGLYRKYEFEYIEQPMGSTGHGGCSVFMLKTL